MSFCQLATCRIYSCMLTAPIWGHLGPSAIFNNRVCNYKLLCIPKKRANGATLVTKSVNSPTRSRTLHVSRPVGNRIEVLFISTE
jgi:hypothetical protein